MIELTQQQAEALERDATTPPRVVNPRTNERFVLLHVEEYERLKGDDGALPTPRDEWERRLLGLAKDCGVSLSDQAVSREALYE